MKKLFKYSQQIIIALVIASASVGIVFAAPGFIKEFSHGFIRDTIEGQGIFEYGFGITSADGNGNQTYGYGYGYDRGDRAQYWPDFDYVEYGFEGDDGSVTIESVDVTQTTATVTFSTKYLAKVLAVYGLTDPVDEFNYIGLSQEQVFNSGQRVLNLTDLTCGTTYYTSLVASDASGYKWPLNGPFTTSSCSSSHGTQVVGGNVNNPVVIPSSPSLKLRLPPITLALGSIGIDVQDLQILLNHIGVFLDNHGAGSPGEETQYFGQKTFAAVKAFQQVFDLKKVDGIYGIETQSAMKSFLN